MKETNDAEAQKGKKAFSGEGGDGEKNGEFPQQEGKGGEFLIVELSDQGLGV